MNVIASRNRRCRQLMEHVGLELVWSDSGPQRDAFVLLQSIESVELRPIQALALRACFAVWNREIDVSILDVIETAPEERLEKLGELFAALNHTAATHEPEAVAQVSG